MTTLPDPQAVARRLVARPPQGAPSDAAAPPGAVVGFLVGDERAVGSAGCADPATGEPMRAELRFDLASVTKALATTVAVASLVGHGALELDAPVRALLPAFPGHDGTTIRHLLLHRAGLPAWQPLYLAPDGAARALDSLGPQLPLDTEFVYSDVGFLHLGRVVAAAAGAPLPEAVRELALVPLGIPGAGYTPGAGDVACAPSARGDAAERTMVATGEPYPVAWSGDGFAWREHLLRGEANDGNCWHGFAGVAGHAGLFATVDELLTAGAALTRSVAGEGPLPARVARELVVPGPDPGQALGLRRDGAWAWHPGYTGCALGFTGDAVVAVATNRLLAAGTPVPTVLLWHDATATLGPPTWRGAP